VPLAPSAGILNMAHGSYPQQNNESIRITLRSLLCNYVGYATHQAVQYKHLCRIWQCYVDPDEEQLLSCIPRFTVKTYPHTCIPIRWNS
jgi:hypothetical protein